MKGTDTQQRILRDTLVCVSAPGLIRMNCALDLAPPGSYRQAHVLHCSEGNSQTKVFGLMHHSIGDALQRFRSIDIWLSFRVNSDLDHSTAKCSLRIVPFKSHICVCFSFYTYLGQNTQFNCILDDFRSWKS